MSVAPVMNPSEAAGGRSDRNKRMDVKNRDQMEYLTERTLIRDFIPYPRFLLDMKLTQTARILYALLLDRSKISRNNGWKNEKGYVYVIYPIMDLAQVLDKSHMTIKKLERTGRCGTFRKTKAGFFKAESAVCQNPGRGKEKFPCEGKKSVPQRERK